MGEDALKSTPLQYEVIYSFTGLNTSEDTQNACRRFINEGVELIVFCGGERHRADRGYGRRGADKQLSGHLSVLSGNRMAQRKEVRRG